MVLGAVAVPAGGPLRGAGASRGTAGIGVCIAGNTRWPG
jgi:hypothetical protein